MLSTFREGYNVFFLGDDYPVPMPEPGLEIMDDVLVNGNLRESYIADYVHYSVVMSESNRQAFFTAANLDQNEYKSGIKGRKWFLDSRIGAENQIGDEAYNRNDWDKGHLTRRTAVTWGTRELARKASNDSCSYANSCMQHQNFNRDEWKVPEKIVHEFDRDKNNRLCIFTGPIFTEIDRWYTRRGLHEPVRIPSAFWKIIVYISKATNELESLAFLMHQDDFFITDRRGRRRIKAKNYQVSTTEIEKLTGLEFPDLVYERNPLYFAARDKINKGPEGFVAPDKKNIDEGLVFTRNDAESKKFKKKKRDIKEDELSVIACV